MRLSDYKEHFIEPDYPNYYGFVISRIKHRCVKSPSGCLEYGAGKLKHKYGLISITIAGKRLNVTAHRAMFMAVNKCFGLPKHVLIRHTCDNPCCANEDHLVIGTHQDNTNDKLERDRYAKKYKPHTRIRRLTDEQVIAIKNGKEKPSYYCWKYKISVGYVSKLRSGKAKALVS